MKKVLCLLIVFMGLITFNVNAAEYKELELIPVNSGGNITVTTNYFKYINIKYNNNKISFGTIRNISSEDKAVTVSIGFFDEKKINIGTVNYCSKDNNLAPKQGIVYAIDFDKDILAPGKTTKDIKYMAIISDNINCNVGNSQEYVGDRIEEIGQPKNNTLSDSEKRLINLLLVIGGVGLFIFVYNYLFSNKYKNFDGEDVRQNYNYINKKLARKREYDAINNPPQPKPRKQEKSDKVIAEEKLEKSKENTDSSDLHNFYK